MAKGYRIEKPEPEFYFHFELMRPIAEHEWVAIREKLQQIARTAFREAFSGLDVELEFDVDLERGSIRGWIRSKKKVVAAILITLANAMIQYDNLRSGLDRLHDDVTAAWTFTKAQVDTYMDSEYGIEQRIRTERRVGAVARLDHLIGRYQRGDIAYDEYIAEATAVLEKIQQSPERDEIIHALREYMDARQVNWQALAERVPGVPRDPQPPRDDGQRNDAAILTDDERRRRRQRGER